MKRLQNLSDEESLRKMGLFTLEKWRLQEFNGYKYLRRGCKKDRAMVFSVPIQEAMDTRGSFWVWENPYLLCRWQNSAQVDQRRCGVSSIETFRSCLDVVLNSLLWVSLLEEGLGLSHSPILWFWLRRISRHFSGYKFYYCMWDPGESHYIQICQFFQDIAKTMQMEMSTWKMEHFTIIFLRKLSPPIPSKM